MSLTNGPNLGLLVNGNAGEGHYTDLMKQWRGLDALVMPNVKGYLTNTPPGSPSDGDCYVVGAAPTGAWAGNGGKVARWSSVASAWEFYTPRNGWMIQASTARETYRYTASAWEIYYQEGAWTPTPTGIGGSGITYDASYTRVGNAALIRVRILGTGVTTTALASWITLPFAPSKTSSCVIANADVSQPGSGRINTYGFLYLPTMAATASLDIYGTLFI